MSTLGRAVLIIWLFVVLIIQSSYTASLTSILTVQQLTSPIKGIDSLIAGDEFIGFQVGSFAENYMVEELHIARPRLRPLGSAEEFARSLELGSENGGVAAIVDERPYAELFLSRNCQFAIVGSEFTKSGWGFAFPRASPLAIDMSTAILTLSENGDLQRIHDKGFTRAACISETDEINSERFDLSGFWGLFLLCGVACGIPVLICLISTFHQYLRSSSREQEDPSSQQMCRSGRSLRKFLSFVDNKGMPRTNPREERCRSQAAMALLSLWHLSTTLDRQVHSERISKVRVSISLLDQCNP